jgi:hypothetical protein
MAGIAINQRIDTLGAAIVLRGGLAGILLWIAILLLRGSFGLVELGVLAGLPVFFGVTLRAVARVV